MFLTPFVATQHDPTRAPTTNAHATKERNTTPRSSASHDDAPTSPTPGSPPPPPRPITSQDRCRSRLTTRQEHPRTDSSPLGRTCQRYGVSRIIAETAIGPPDRCQRDDGGHEPGLVCGPQPSTHARLVEPPSSISYGQMRQSGEMTDRDWVGFNAGIIEEFRANDGKVAAFGDLPVIVLHTIGALTGAVRLTPLIPVFDGDRMYIFGTAEGASKDPAWAGNLRTHPRITIETATASFVADVLALPEVDARRMIDERAATTPKLREYVASAAPRTIPVFSITPIK